MSQYGINKLNFKKWYECPIEVTQGQNKIRKKIQQKVHKENVYILKLQVDRCCGLLCVTVVSGSDSIGKCGRLRRPSWPLVCTIITGGAKTFLTLSNITGRILYGEKFLFA